MTTLIEHTKKALPSRAHIYSGLAALFLVVAFAGMAWGQQGSFRHEYIMRGKILEIDDGSPVLCVGKRDGARVGQELEVIRHERASLRPKQTGPRFRRTKVGTVRITSVFDEHYAIAEVIDGTAEVNDIVELEWGSELKLR